MKRSHFDIFPFFDPEGFKPQNFLNQAGNTYSIATDLCWATKCPTTMCSNCALDNANALELALRDHPDHMLDLLGTVEGYETYILTLRLMGHDRMADIAQGFLSGYLEYSKHVLNPYTKPPALPNHTIGKI